MPTKVLYRNEVLFTSEVKSMAKNISCSMKEDKLIKAIKEAQKNPKFTKEIKEFIKATTNVYKLN